jgi:transcriptional regulator with PAS, ATPase and Fis domain
LKIVKKVAGSSSTVLILGESGTGKELFARAIHYDSVRADRPFVPINCGAIPENMLESELFGYMKGAFTGAGTNRKGLFEAARGGSVFLDEIGDISPKLQMELLRVLQERSFYRVGGTDLIEVDVRVIAATNMNLQEAVREGTFREEALSRPRSFHSNSGRSHQRKG